ncbi:RLA class II histocompatibility antigen, DP alpha-1 chain-like isoform X1 [Oreochromis aureus]|uniref:Ig-like domain-containing protein n=1 Tax=Oreochromis aureus TaxID=47969 RepID=A0A668TBT1_OREAU|nr:RLA class II histocompatibility antigen, DP alpha-1 chain-like isoform X1 [Oreochromis aureus]
MKMKVWVLLLVLSSVICVSADGLYEMNSVSGCSDTDGEDVLILDDEVVWYTDFNKQKGVDSLPAFADHPSFEGKYEEAVANQLICRQNLKMARTAMKDFPKRHEAPSSVAIYTTLNVEIGVQNTLICHVTGFYPAPVNVTWNKNTKKVVEGTSITVPLSNKDGTFTQTSKLDFVPKGGDVYACIVEHVALTQPLTKVYAVDNAEPILGPAIFCGVGLTVGVLGVAAGIYLFIRGRK